MQQLRELVNDETVQQLRKQVESIPKSELVAGADPSTWPQLREKSLLQSGLIEAGRIPETDKTFLRFHPTLAPALWQKLDKEEQDALLEAIGRHTTSFPRSCTGWTERTPTPPALLPGANCRICSGLSMPACRQTS